LAIIVKTSFSTPSLSIIEKAVNVIENEGLVVGITDTVYGIFTNALCSHCVDRVFEVKEREGKPIPVLVSSIKHVIDAADEISDEVLCLLKYMWPGPVTLIIPVKKDFFPYRVHLGRNKVGFRIPAAPLPRLLAEKIGGYLTGTSANISGKPSPRHVFEAIKQLGDRIDLYIDSGIAPIGLPSTVIEIVGDEIKVIREGSISTNVITMAWRYCCEKCR